MIGSACVLRIVQNGNFFLVSDMLTEYHYIIHNSLFKKILLKKNNC